MSAIRFATESCLDELVVWGKNFHNYSPYSDEALKRPDAIKVYLKWHVVSTEACILRTDYGMIGGVLQPALDYVNGIVARESFLWCERAGDGLRLVSALENWAVKRGASHIEMSVLSDVTGERLSQVLKRRGYDHLQTVLRKQFKASK